MVSWMWIPVAFAIGAWAGKSVYRWLFIMGLKRSLTEEAADPIKAFLYSRFAGR